MIFRIMASIFVLVQVADLIEGVREKRNSEICSLPQAVGQGRAAFRRFWYNAATNQCEQFIFGGGQGGNANNFETEQACMQTCASGNKGASVFSAGGSNSAVAATQISTIANINLIVPMMVGFILSIFI